MHNSQISHSQYSSDWLLYGGPWYYTFGRHFENHNKCGFLKVVRLSYCHNAISEEVYRKAVQKFIEKREMVFWLNQNAGRILVCAENTHTGYKRLMRSCHDRMGQKHFAICPFKNTESTKASTYFWTTTTLGKSTDWSWTTIYFLSYICSTILYHR